MSFMKHSITAGVLVAGLVFSGTGSAAPETVNTEVNPHENQESCEVCHLLPTEKLGGFFTSKTSKRQLSADHVNLCRQCHGMGFGHGVGKKPDMNREGLPLADDGTITCATTCHAMHVNNPADHEQGHYHLRLPVLKLCFSCHEK